VQASIPGLRERLADPRVEPFPHRCGDPCSGPPRTRGKAPMPATAAVPGPSGATAPRSRLGPQPGRDLRSAV